ncbi:MAG: ammonium transporter [bacterium]|nr:ammonium transporter [bacterium]
MDPQTVDTLWLLLCSGLVFLMQPGFMCLESGLTRSKNSIDVAIKNLADFGVSVSLFWAFGYALMYGASVGGWFGGDRFLPGFENLAGWPAAFFVFQAMFCGTAVTIVSGAVAERLRFGGYLLISLLLSGPIYTLFGHWAWNGTDARVFTGWLGELGFRDFAGATVVHGVGGWVALAAVLVIGPRRGRYPPDGPPRELRGHDLPVSILGAFLLWLGWFGFNGGAALGWSDRIPAIIANSILAGAGGLITALVIGTWMRGRPAVKLAMNGALAGLVAITGGCHAVGTLAALLIGTIGALVMVAASLLLERWRVDDVVGAFPVHAAAGAWGTLAVALFGDLETLASGLGRVDQLAVQALGVVTCSLWAFGGGYLALRLIGGVLRLRVTPEEELQGLNVVEHGATTELLDLVTAMEKQAISGDLSLRADAGSQTEVGQIATQYNRVIGALQQAMQELRASADRYRRTIDNALDAIITIGEKGEIVGWNPQAEALFGWSREEAMGQDVFELITAQPDREVTRSGLFSFLTAGGESTYIDQRVEVSGIDRDGRQFPMEATFTMAAHGEKMEFNLFLQDITERHRARRALQLAKEAAESAGRAKSEFLANISHEIRTPMNGILGITELMLDTEITSRQRGYLEMIKASADSLLVLLNDILDFSKVEAGKLDFQEIGFNLRDHLSGILGALEVEAAEKGLALECRVQPEVPDGLVGDPARLGQILINLVSNAIKFTAEGEVVVDVGVDEASETEAVLRLTVRDTGVGIPEEKQERIFKAFEQADTSTTRQFGGTGLGLTISRRLVEKMGGRIWVESQPGSGSSFHFTARFALMDEAAALRSLADGESERRRALVVEDNRINQVVAQGMLERWQIVSEIASSGTEALAALEEQAFDLVLLDMNMPDMDGFEVTAAIREADRESGGHIPVIAMTANVLPGDRERCLEAGMDGYVAKPIEKAVLARAMRRVGFANLVVAEPPPSATPVAVAGESSFDQPLLVRRLDGRVDRALQLATIFLEEDAPEHLTLLARAIEEGDTGSIVTVAHALRGATTELCAITASAAAEQLEEVARGDDQRHLHEKCETLEREIQNLMRDLEAFVGT